MLPFLLPVLWAISDSADGSCEVPAIWTHEPHDSSDEADEHIAEMSRYSQNHAMLDHTFLRRFQRGAFIDMKHAIRAFAKEHYTYSKNFIQYLRAVVDKVPDDATKAPILENIEEESGNYEDGDLVILESHGVKREWVNKKPHKELIKHFLDTIEVNVEDSQDSAPGVQFTKYMLNLYAKSNACEGLAILGFAIEDTVSTLYQFIWDGLKKANWLEPKDYVFFPLHILVDDGHADLLKAAYKKYLVKDKTMCREAPRLVSEVLSKRMEFMDQILALADAPPATSLPLSDGDADSHIAQMSQFSLNHDMLQHPFLQRFQHGLFLDFPHALRTFAMHHYTYSRNFIKYLRAVVDKVPDEATRAPILENIEEESGNYDDEDLVILESHGVKREWVDKKPHKELIKHFLDKIEVKFNDDPSSPGVQFTKYMLDIYARSNACEGLAILGFAIEDTVSTLYEFIWGGLKKADWLKAEDYVFFPLHILVDDGHADLLKAAYKKYLVSDSEQCAGAPKLVLQVLQRRIQFMDEILALADAPPPTSLPLSDEAASKHVATMSQFSQNHRLLSHPFLTRFSQASFADFRHAVRSFGKEHYTYSRKFIQYLRAVVDKVPDDATRAPILENIEEESGNYEKEDLDTLEKHGVKASWVDKKPHKELIAHFLKAIDVEISEPENTPGGRFTKYMLDLYAKSNACEGLAVLGFAIEDTVSSLYEFIWDGLKRSWLKPQDYVFFPLHILVDDGHADLLKAAYKMYLTGSIESARSCANAPSIVARVLERREQFLDEILQIADKPPLVATADGTSQAEAIRSAQKSTVAKLQHPQYTVSQKIALSARFLHSAGHTNSLAGQISCLEMQPDGSFGMRTLQYGMGFDEALPSNLILVDRNLNNTDPKNPSLFPNYAIRFHIHIYLARPDTRCIVHTHPPHLNALGLTGEMLAADHMDMLGLFQQVAFERTWPGVPFGDEEGRFLVNALGTKHHAAILAHHGMLALGRNVEEATYRAFFLEENAALQLKVMGALGNSKKIPRVAEDLATAAQKWRMSAGPVNAHFHYWARQVLQKHPDILEK